MRENSARHFGRDATGLSDRTWDDNASSGTQALITATKRGRSNNPQVPKIHKIRTSKIERLSYLERVIILCGIRGELKATGGGTEVVVVATS
jgi:hypothetical protein